MPMRNFKKVATMTFHWAANYGAVLQAYALQRFLQQEGLTTEVIDYIPFRINLIMLLMTLKARDWATLRKQVKLTKFRRRHLRVSPKRYQTNRQLFGCRDRYDAVICGSDQIWNYGFTMHAEAKPTLSYFLNFAGENTRRIAYAVSFGADTVPDEYIQTVKPEIDKFWAVSVREKTGLDIAGQLQTRAHLVCDPTFLLQKRDYEQLIGDVKCQVVPVFSYILHKEQPLAEQVSGFVSKTFNTSVSPKTICCSMEEWLYQIGHTEMMVTNSFHGVALSLIMHTPFVVVPVKGSQMNDRIITLLRAVGLEERFVESYDEAQLTSLCEEQIDWEQVDRGIARLREPSVTFLRESLS